jgi:DNA replication protein DnaC
MNRTIQTQLTALRLPWMREHLDTEIAEAARKNRPHSELMERLLEGEYNARRSRAVDRLIRAARLPGRASLAAFDFHFPKEINADLVRHLFTLSFMTTHSNVVFIGPVGVGKTHLATALARQACEERKKVLFTPAAAMLNDLLEAQQHHNLQTVLKRYLNAQLLVIDELGYLPVDKIARPS